MMAIQTKFHGPTETKGSRYSAQIDRTRVIISADSALDAKENHVRAAETLIARKDLDLRIVGTGLLPDFSYAHIVEYA
jgi:hypothetical protein